MIRRASRRQGRAAPRWPPASLDSSHAQRKSAVKRGTGRKLDSHPYCRRTPVTECGCTLTHRCASPSIVPRIFPGLYSAAIYEIARRKPWPSVSYSPMTWMDLRLHKPSATRSTARNTRSTCQMKTSSGSMKHLSPSFLPVARFPDKLHRHDVVGETAKAAGQPRAGLGFVASGGIDVDQRSRNREWIHGPAKAGHY